MIYSLDILPSLMQYSSAFYNLASSTSLITQNHSNLGNFIFNNLNGYFDGFNILLEIHRQELDKYLRILKLFVIFIGVGILCLFVLNFYLIISSFMNAIIIRGNYIKVFFGINETVLRNLISNCENLMNRMKTSEEQRFHEEETLNETIDEEIKILENIKNNKNSFSSKSSLNYGIEIKSNNKASYTGIIFIIIFGLFNIISYIFIIYNGIYMINTSRKSILINEINMKMHNHHISVIYYFNIYREFLFDDKSEINDINIIKYLDDYEKGKVLGVLEDMDNIGPILSNMVSNISYFAIPLCSYYINDYFDSSNECEEKIGLISKTEITFITTYFFEEIKIGKNFAKIKFKEETILGNLTNYNFDEYSNLIRIIGENTDDISSESYHYLDEENGPNNYTIFRLDLFNSEILHKKLNEIFFCILLPYIEKNSKIVYEDLNIKGSDKTIKVLIISFYIVMILIFSLYFIPIISFINMNIYKTKNMLSIIPLDILSSQSGVSELLNISKEK